MKFSRLEKALIIAYVVLALLFSASVGALTYVVLKSGLKPIIERVWEGDRNG